MFTQPQQYKFGGDPVSQAAAVAAHKAQMAAEGQIGAANQTAQGMYGAAQQNAFGSLYGAPAEAYKAYVGAGANAYGNYAQGLGMAANAQAGLYGNYNTSLANLYGSQTAAMGQTETARQLGLANLGSSALSAGGQAAGAAMGAWGQNQSSFAKAMSDSQAANQQAMSQYGVGRESALAALGNSAANYGGSLANAQSQYGQSAAAARGNMLTGLAATDLGGYNSGLNYGRDMAKLGLARELGTGQLTVGSQTASTLPAAFSGMGGLQLTADGNPSASVDPSGPYAGGGYDGGGSGAGGGYPQPTSFGKGREWYQNQQFAPEWQSKTPAAMASMDAMDDKVLGGLSSGSANAFGAIDRSRQDVANSPVLGSLMSQANAGRGQLDNAYYSSRNMPSQMLAQSMSGFQGMLGTASRGLNSGMNQFYANIPRDGADRMQAALQQGAADLNSTVGRLGSGFSSASNNQRSFGEYRDMMREVMDRTGVVSPVEQQRQQFQMQDERNARAIALRDKLRQERMARTMSRTQR